MRRKRMAATLTAATVALTSTAALWTINNGSPVLASPSGVDLGGAKRVAPIAKAVNLSQSALLKRLGPEASSRSRIVESVGDAFVGMVHGWIALSAIVLIAFAFRSGGLVRYVSRPRAPPLLQHG